MIEQGYSRCAPKHCAHFRKLDEGSYIILLLYVDDMLLEAPDMQEINVIMRKLVNSFGMMDLGATKQILGMRITRERKNHKLTFSQSEYIKKVLERFII